MPTSQTARADEAAPPQGPPAGRRARSDDRSHARDVRPGFFVKLAIIAIVDAFGVYAILAALNAQAWGVLISMAVLVAAANWVYFTRRTLPLKYILPGLAFLLVYQVYVMAYTGYVAFTNYGDGHNSTKSHAIDALLIQNERRVEGSAAYQLSVVTDSDGAIGFAVVDPDGAVEVGTAQDPLTPVEDAQVDEGRVTAVPGWTVLDRPTILQRQDEVTTLRVPISDDAEDGSIRTQDARVGYVFRSVLEYDAAADTMTDTSTGVVYTPTDRGQFQAPDGTTLAVGWRVFVGFENFTTAFSDARYTAPFFKILGWTFAFAFLSVVTTFLLGLFLAMAFNDPRLKGRRIYRTLMVLPYAIPGFVGALLWSGLLNRRFGFVNSVLLGGADVGWLTDPWLAKLSILLVNLWLGFPYMFLICTGALQSLPGDVLEAAKIDGASRFRSWRSVTMPLLLVSTAPLLISSFAFNFNNFNLIYMLTGGGPRDVAAGMNAGATDILISMVYKVAFVGTNRDYGLASAFAIIIFVLVGAISVAAFRRTKSLEELN